METLKNHYSTVNDVILTYGEITETNYLETLEIEFEQPTEKGYKIARMLLPAYDWQTLIGFDEDEICQLEDYAFRNGILIWDLARRGE